jgi:isopentenyl phosphate kinase
MTVESTDGLVFVKLGGSVITDKNRSETDRPEVIARLADEVAHALAGRPDLRLILGHGSGSFGHTVAQHYGTRQGVRTRAQWQGFAEVATVAATLNRIVTEQFLEAGVPAWSLQPSASAWCRAGDLVSLATRPIAYALDRGMVPMVYGDVALDEVQGGTIISTEQIFAYLACRFRPGQLVLVGAVDGVYDEDPLRNPFARRIPEISRDNWEEVRAKLGGSHATDVTGGMQTKVEEVVHLARELPGLTGHIISGERPGALEGVLLDPTTAVGGTVVHWQGDAATGT